MQTKSPNTSQNADSKYLNLSRALHVSIGFFVLSIAQGCTLVSLYLRHSVGLSADNRKLLEEAAAELAQIKGPWVIADGR